MSDTRFPLLIALATIAAGAVAFASPGGIGAPFGAVIVWLVPGAALAALVSPRLGRLDLLLAALVFSPVLVALAAALILLAGGSGESAARITIAGFSVAGAIAALRVRPASDGAGRGPLITLGVGIALLCILTGLLPQLVEWWRIRSDAWFHAAVIAEVRDYGIPPMDPYFAGLPLQYMWLYHVLVDLESTVIGLDVFRTMGLVNIRALAGLVLGVFLLGRELSGRWDRAAGSALMVPLGLNAMFWFLLPVKLARAFVGEVHGFEEVARQLRLTPFDFETVVGFMRIYNNPEFYMDKYLVMTAFSLGLTLMAVCWLGAVRYTSRGDRYGLVIVFVSMLGTIAFHSLVAFVVLASFGGALAIGWLRRDRPLTTASLRVTATALLACAVMSPYIYSVMHAKHGGHLIPVSITLGKTVAMLLSATSAFVLLYPFQRQFFQRRDTTATFFMAGTLALVAFCLLLRLPQSNAYDKPGYFVWLPFAVVAGWTLADLWQRRSRSTRDALIAWGLAFFMLVPVNALALTACYVMATPEEITASDRKLAAWAAAETSRDAVFIDHDMEVALLVLGPRRYYFGRVSYAVHWGYDRSDMAMRFHVRRSVLGGRLDARVLEVLGGFPSTLYIVDRGDAVCARYPELFEAVYEGDELTVWRVRRDACRRAAATAPPGPRDMDALIGEAGL